MEQEIKTQMKMDIVNWFKENFPKCIIGRKSLKDIVRMMKHEIIHYRISEKFIEDVSVKLEITLFTANPGFGYNSKCLTRYPLIYNGLQYYPKYIFIEFNQYLYDMIYNIFSLRGLKYLIRYTKGFIKTLFKFKINNRCG